MSKNSSKFATHTTRGQPTNSKRKEFLTVQDLAERWQISPRQIRRYIEVGELKVARFGSAVRIHISAALGFEHRAHCAR